MAVAAGESSFCSTIAPNQAKDHALQAHRESNLAVRGRFDPDDSTFAQQRPVVRNGRSNRGKSYLKLYPPMQRWCTGAAPCVDSPATDISGLSLTLVMASPKVLPRIHKSCPNSKPDRPPQLHLNRSHCDFLGSHFELSASEACAMLGRSLSGSRNLGKGTVLSTYCIIGPGSRPVWHTWSLE